jgi:hypothetical protein
LWPQTKRPPVETEGRLTIACHMKRDNDLVVASTKLSVEFEIQRAKDYQIVKNLIQAAKTFFQTLLFRLTTCLCYSESNVGRIFGTCKLVCQHFRKKS